MRAVALVGIRDTEALDEACPVDVDREFAELGPTDRAIAADEPVGNVAFVVGRAPDQPCAP